MDSYGGMTPTLRRFSGPALDLVELTSDKGLKHTAIVFHAAHRDHPTLTSDIQEFLGFMENPDVDGLPKLVWHDPVEGVFVYPTGLVWSVAEVVRAFAGLGKQCGVRAGLELAYHAGQILLEAATVGAELDVFSHTSLSPWNVLLKADGQVRVVGFGIPQPDVALYVDDETKIPVEDSLRYCPPERLEGHEEDFTSDLFSLALISLEVMTGKPVYDGLLKDILQQASRAEGQRKLYQLRDVLPNDVREVMGRCLKFDPDARYQDGADFIYGVHDLLSSPDVEGPSLAEVIQTVKMAQKKGKILIGGQTGALTKEELAALTAELDEEVSPGEITPPRLQREQDEAEPEAEPEQPRWGKVGRGRRRSGAEAAAEPRRRTRRGAPAEESEPAPRSGRRRTRRSEPAEPEEAPRGRSRRGSGDSGERRLRRSGEPAAREPSARPDPPAEPRRSRSRRGSREPEPSARSESPRSEEPRRRRSSRDEAAAGGGADALLRRMRSSQEGAPRSRRAKADSPPPPKPSVVDEASSPEDKIYFSVAVEGKAHRTKLKRAAPLAESAWRISDALCGGPPTDLHGNLLGWYRLQQGRAYWRGDETTAVLDPDGEVSLTLVPNTTVVVDFEVKSGKRATRFQAPVGTAVTARSLVGHLRRWLSLPEGAWKLEVEGSALHPLQTLGDFETSDSLKVVVTK